MSADSSTIDQERVFRLELGLNLRAAELVRTRWKHRYFPLENALVDLTQPEAPRPAWFTHLRAGDRFSIRLVDISDLEDPREPQPRPALIQLHFTEPDSGDIASPFFERIESWQISMDSIHHWSPVFSRSRTQLLPTWEITGRTPIGDAAELTFAPVTTKRGFQGFQLSVALGVERDPWRDFFVFDPEMIVSARDVPPDPDPVQEGR